MCTNTKIKIEEMCDWGTDVLSHGKQEAPCMKPKQYNLWCRSFILSFKHSTTYVFAKQQCPDAYKSAGGCFIIFLKGRSQ